MKKLSINGFTRLPGNEPRVMTEGMGRPGLFGIDINLGLDDFLFQGDISLSLEQLENLLGI
ncbi:hypothetical protein [Chitinophaga sp.]|uniref:hypothetical protein n=1 Tax=Chitinophaga sp. TaxID=1869181 RepID=UPI002F94CB2D